MKESKEDKEEIEGRYGKKRKVRYKYNVIIIIDDASVI